MQRTRCEYHYTEMVLPTLPSFIFWFLYLMI